MMFEQAECICMLYRSLKQEEKSVAVSCRYDDEWVFFFCLFCRLYTFGADHVHKVLLQLFFLFAREGEASNNTGDTHGELLSTIVLKACLWSFKFQYRQSKLE
ncbi:unnamed protein product [Ixodes pacificus]